MATEKEEAVGAPPIVKFQKVEVSDKGIEVTGPDGTVMKKKGDKIVVEGDVVFEP